MKKIENKYPRDLSIEEINNNLAPYEYETTVEGKLDEMIEKITNETSLTHEELMEYGQLFENKSSGQVFLLSSKNTEDQINRLTEDQKNPSINDSATNILPLLKERLQNERKKLKNIPQINNKSNIEKNINPEDNQKFIALNEESGKQLAYFELSQETAEIISHILTQIKAAKQNPMQEEYLKNILNIHIKQIQKELKECNLVFDQEIYDSIKKQYTIGTIMSGDQAFKLISNSLLFNAENYHRTPKFPEKRQYIIKQLPLLAKQKRPIYPKDYLIILCPGIISPILEKSTSEKTTENQYPNLEKIIKRINPKLDAAAKTQQSYIEIIKYDESIFPLAAELRENSFKEGEQNNSLSGAKQSAKSIQSILKQLDTKITDTTYLDFLKTMLANNKDRLLKELSTCNIKLNNEINKEIDIKIGTELNNEQTDFLINKTNHLFDGNIDQSTLRNEYRDKTFIIGSLPITALNEKNEIVVLAPGIITLK